MRLSTLTIVSIFVLASCKGATQDLGASCPNGRGPTMAPTSHGCIDTTEVTQAQYAEFLGALGVQAQSGVCSFNSSFVPGVQARGVVCDPQFFDPVHAPNRPVTCVDWCDAAAYCSWAGKRLCGRVGGGALGFGEQADPTKSEWMAACSRDGRQEYPYGRVHMPNTCQEGPFKPFARPVPDVASASSCVGGFPGIFDMSGNVLEWEDSCDGSAGEQDRCAARGGNIGSSDAGALACNAMVAAPRGGMGIAAGFRCCSD